MASAELLAEILATGSYVTALEGTALYKSALDSRANRVIGLIRETNFDAYTAAKVVNAIRALNLPSQTTDILMNSVHDQMLSAPDCGAENVHKFGSMWVVMFY